MSFIERAAAKIRALLGLGAFGGLAGAAVGALWAVPAKLMGLDGASLVSQMIDLGLLGAVAGGGCAAGFGALLVALEAKKSLDQLPLWRMAMLGAGVGAALPALFLLLTSGTIHFATLPTVVASILGTGAILGGALCSTLVALAKGAHRAELAVVDEVAGLLGSE